MRRKVTKVIDGDTFKVSRRVNGSQYVRLAGVNAAEKYQYGGRHATNRLKGMIGGKQVSIIPVGKSYGRTVANVRVNRKSVNKRLR
jgi:endonuclease YncB( thermonuclease family)